MPTQLGAMTKLSSNVMLYSNDLTGSLPTELNQIKIFAQALNMDTVYKHFTLGNSITTTGPSSTPSGPTPSGPTPSTLLMCTADAQFCPTSGTWVARNPDNSCTYGACPLPRHPAGPPAPPHLHARVPARQQHNSYQL